MLFGGVAYVASSRRNQRMAGSVAKAATKVATAAARSASVATVIIGSLTRNCYHGTGR